MSMNKYEEALEAVNEADDCFQPETMDDVRKYFPTIREALERLCTTSTLE
jgi:hypothetical protein